MMIKYHDTEWGKATHSDKQHFEFLILEAAQAGLSWATILKRRAGYAKAFANFVVVKVIKRILLLMILKNISYYE